MQSPNPPAPNPAVITVLCAGAMSRIMRELAGAFEQTTGERVSLEFSRSGIVRDRVRDGASVDVAITTRAAVDHLGGLGKVLTDSVTDMAHSGIGVAIKAGAAKPDIGSATAFERTLRDARSIAYADPATGSPSGNYLVGLFDRLGMSAELKPKTRLIGAAGGHAVIVCDAVAKGDAEIGLQQVSEILPVAGVDLVGPLPPELQHTTTFSAAAATTARNPASARRLIAFLASKAAASVILANGMQPA